VSDTSTSIDPAIKPAKTLSSFAQASAQFSSIGLASHDSAVSRAVDRLPHNPERRRASA